MTTIAERVRLHRENHEEDPEWAGFAFWCVAHDEREDCHNADRDGACSPDCPECPKRCPWCARRKWDA